MASKITYRYAPRRSFSDDDGLLPFSGALTIECDKGKAFDNPPTFDDASEDAKIDAAHALVQALLRIKYPESEYKWLLTQIVSIEPVDSK